MKVSIFGLGYVGTVTAACLARDGIPVLGVDINPEKVAMIADGRAPIIELGLTELLRSGVQSGRLTASTSVTEAIENTEVSFVSVGTPTRSDGATDLSYVHNVCEEIGKAIAIKGQPHTVVIRSTVLPGTTADCEEILISHAGSIDVSVAFNPEFLREGSAIRDYDSPAYSIIGTTSKRAERVLRELYASIQAPVIVTSSGVAEMIKYAANGWHATKITFANEIGRVAKSVGVDGRDVMNILTQDMKLNISPMYMRPGFAYGGSCLPKDVRALAYLGSTRNISLPLISSLAPSNLAQIELAAQQVLALGKRRIGLLGLAFKANTDDLRESPAVELAERLMGKGCELKIMDNAVRQARLIGANKQYIEGKIPHLSRLLVGTPMELLEHAEVVVVTHGAAEFRDIIKLIDAEIPILDLTGILQTHPAGKTYSGIAW
ncbi:MAG: UDP-glucose/GDP-mannose dehydrogenase family protein [Opitutales bacterium]